VLERHALVPFLQRQRWFGSKSHQMRHARFGAWATLRRGSTPAFLATIAASYADGPSEVYLLPLALATGDEARRLLHEAPHAVLARVTGARKGVLVDGYLDDDVCSRLLALVAERREIAMGRGLLRGEGSTIELPAEPRWARCGSDQSNSLAWVADRYVLKLFRRIEPGLNPELEVGRFLTERGFTRAPQTYGALQYAVPGVEPSALAVVQQVVRHQGSAWDFTIDELKRYYERVAARAVEPPVDPPAAGDQQPPPLFAALENWYLAGAATLGRRTAELHLALAHASEPSFAPERLETTDLAALGDAMAAQASGVLEMLASRLPGLADRPRAQAEAVLAQRDALVDRLRRVRHIVPAGTRIRVHGDYHLGQVLRTEEDFVIVDFEGEPARPIAARRAKQSPLKDVAGMVRSFSYAAYAALLTFSVNTATGALALEAWADTWQHWVIDAFLRTYRVTIEPSGLVPEGAAFDDLLSVFTIEKAVYELGYELNHRPDWVGIPLTGLLKRLA
jgi:maltose alpha-D-glucosyltransferase/alpha-amylase